MVPMKVEGWKFIFRFNLWSCCMMMGWEMWLLYLSLQVCTDSFGPWTQREHPSVFRYNFFYKGTMRRVLLFQKGNRQGAQWMCIEATNHKLLPTEDRTLRSLVPSVSWVSSGCLKAEHLGVTTVCWILSRVCWVESCPTQKGRPRDHSGHWSLKM